MNLSCEDRFWIEAVFKRTNRPFEVMGRPEEVPALVITLRETCPVMGRMVPGRCSPVVGRPLLVIGRIERVLEFILRLKVDVPGRANSFMTLYLNNSSVYSYVSISKSSIKPCSKSMVILSSQDGSSCCFSKIASKISNASIYFFLLYNFTD